MGYQDFRDAQMRYGQKKVTTVLRIPARITIILLLFSNDHVTAIHTEARYLLIKQRSLIDSRVRVWTKISRQTSRHGGMVNRSPVESEKAKRKHQSPAAITLRLLVARSIRAKQRLASCDVINFYLDWPYRWTFFGPLWSYRFVWR